MKVRVSELTGKDLDYAVGKANGWIDYPEDSIEHGDTWHCDPDRAPFGRTIEKRFYTPSTDGEQGMYIIEQARICVKTAPSHLDTTWRAYLGNVTDSQQCYSRGDTPLIAAMRCYVTSKLGPEIEIPTPGA